MITKTSVQIRFSDIDSLGHVYNSIYNTYYDLGKSDFFADVLNIPKLFTKKGFVQASLTSNFYIPVFVDDKIEVLTHIEKIGNKSITMFQQILDTENNVIKSDCRSILVSFDVESQKSMDMPAEWRKNFEAIL